MDMEDSSPGSCIPAEMRERGRGILTAGVMEE